MIRQYLKDFLVGLWIIVKGALWLLLMLVSLFAFVFGLTWLLGMKLLIIALLVLILILFAVSLGEEKRNGNPFREDV